MLSPKALRAAWEKFSCGDPLSNPELNALIAQCEAALPYLKARGPGFRLALVPTLQAHNTLLEYKAARQVSRSRLA